MRQRMTVKEVRKMCGWQLGDEGEQIADLWVALNELAFKGDAEPAPISFPASMPYGHCIGQTLCMSKQGQEHIEIQQGKDMQEKADILFHEMLHQYLSQQEREFKHNSVEWCSEITRLSKLFWGKDIWAAPVKVGKIVVGHSDGKQVRQSIRMQAESPDGKESATMDKIRSWPDSFGLHVPVADILNGTFKVHKPKTVAKKKATPAKKRVRQITKPKTAKRR